jgi:hypothetical protein
MDKLEDTKNEVVGHMKSPKAWAIPSFWIFLNYLDLRSWLGFKKNTSLI